VGVLSPHHHPVPSLRWLIHAAAPAERLPVKISIVTPSFNQARFLALTLASVAVQAIEDCEHIVVDGGSSDGSVELIRQAAGRLTWWVSERDAGQADAVNKGFIRATGDVLGYLNGDDCLLPGSLAVVSRYFDDHPEVDVIYGNRILVDDEDRLIGSWIMPPHQRGAYAWIDFVPQETMFWRRRLWEKVGGRLDDSMHFALDWSLIGRFASAGARMARIPRFLAAFRVHGAQKTSSMGTDAAKREADRVLAAMHNRSPCRVERILRSVPFLLQQRMEEIRRSADYFHLLRQANLEGPA
jgi:GT2 family glycosyltransferase